MKRSSVTIGFIALVGLLLSALPAAAGQDEGEEGAMEFDGAVEILYRNVDVDGSKRKYDEDFDGLASGGRISNLSLDWRNIGLTAIDYARVEALGLGGDPHQHVGFRFGKSDVYDLTFNYRKQNYLYNLFGLYGDEDASSWDTNRTMTDLKFTYFVTPAVQVFFEMNDRERTGNSLFMKDVERDLFRMETPLDVRERRYAVGTLSQVGAVQIYFRQTWRDYENDFNNSTEGNLGLDQTDLTTLGMYEWRQKESGDASLTEIKLHAPLGKRVDLTFGTWFVNDDLTSRVGLDASGTSFEGTCAVGGGVCGDDADCDAVVPGDVCVANPFTIVNGFSDTQSEVDTTVALIDLSWTVIDPVILHLEYRTLDRDLKSTGQIDLQGTGVPVNVDTTVDWSVDTFTFIVEAHPIRTLTLDLGYRVRDRSLDRNGFLGPRNADFESDGDETLVAGLAWRPVNWFRLDADYEDADIDQPFTNISLSEGERTRVRTVFTPLDGDMRIDLSYLDFENTNTATDFRPFNTFFGSSLKGTNWSASFWYRPIRRVDFLIRYGEQEIDSNASVIFDTASFGGVEPGVSIFDNTNNEGLVQVNFSWADPWKAYVRYWMTESDGDNPLIGDVTGPVNCLPGGTGAVCNSMIEQKYHDAEVGLTYTFANGLYVGGAYRDFDYDDINNLVDYDGNIFTLMAGLTF